MAPTNAPALNTHDFRRSPIYRQNAPIATIQADLQQAMRFYHRVEVRYNYFTVALIICIAAPLVLLFTIPVLRELGWLLIVGFVLAGIYAGTMRNRARQLPFPRDRDRLFGDVLKLLKRDMDPATALDVQLCLGSAEQTGKALKQRPDPHHPGQLLEDWRNPWFVVKGSFLDGNLFGLRLVERSTRSIPEANNSKAGTISRSSGTCCAGFELNLQLHVDQGHYGSLTLLRPHLASAVKLLPGAELLRYHSEGRDLSLSLSLPPAFTASLMYQSITTLFLSVYHVLHLSARLAQDPVVLDGPEALGHQNLSSPAPQGHDWHQQGGRDSNSGHANPGHADPGHADPGRLERDPLHYPGELGS
jgi:hypothetical protein